MATESLQVFISYSRENALFVDRLDSDLRARGFRTWVDRHRLEGGQLWEQEIFAAIAAADLFLIVLSQPAVDSSFVRKELEAAVNQSKRLLPVVFQIYQTHSWLAPVEERQFQYFTDPTSYDTNLRKLLYAILDPTLDLSKSDDSLYSLAISLRVSDPERAMVVLQHMVDRNPRYFGGQARKDLADLEAQVYKMRVARLRTEAEEARQQGQYGVEAASLETLVSLSGAQQDEGAAGNQDVQTVAWAKEYLPIARTNRDMLGPYGVIQDRVAAGDTTTARELLQRLWEQAPYFRDPAGIAPALGLKLPPTYRHDKAVTEDENYRRALAVENENYRRARELVQIPTSTGVPGEANELSTKLRALNYDLPGLSAFALYDYWHEYRSRQQNAHFPIDTANSERRGRIGGAIAGLVAIAIVLLIISASLNMGAGGHALLAVIWGGIALLVATYVRSKNKPQVEQIASVREALADAESQARGALKQWHETAEQLHQARVSTLNEQHSQILADGPVVDGVNTGRDV